MSIIAKKIWQDIFRKKFIMFVKIFNLIWLYSKIFIDIRNFYLYSGLHIHDKFYFGKHVPAELESLAGQIQNQLVIDNEIATMVKRVVGGVRFELELTGVELIKEIGIGGHFLTEDNTLKYLKARQTRSRILDRRMRDQWKHSGAKPLDQTALEQAHVILEAHQVPPCPKM